MYRLKSVDARISFLKNLKSCIKCGRKYSKMHKCRKNRKLEDALCTILHCKLPAALCKAHIKDGNATLELRGWLSRNDVSSEAVFGSMKPKAKVFNIPTVKSTAKTSVKSADRNADVRKNCRAENISTVSNLDESKHSKKVKI